MDYEIHGNGQGKFVDFCYRPTEMMLDIANIYKAKITLMAEFEHYFAMRKYPNVFHKSITLFEKQLSRAIEEGHDVQLHLHPQWINAEYVNKRWLFPYTAKEIALLCNDYEVAFSRVNKAKTWLTDNLKLVNKDYECISYRAGYFQMQPSHNITKALIDNGIFCDTSAVKGMYRDSWNGKIDYRTMISATLPYRASMNDIAVEDETSPIMELPIYSVQYNAIAKKLLRMVKKNEHVSETISRIQRMKIKPEVGSNSEQTLEEPDRILNKLLHYKKYRYLDFFIEKPHTIISSIRQHTHNTQQDMPIVLIAHSKDFVYSNHLKALLDGLSNIPQCRFVTLREAAKEYYYETTKKN